VTGRLVLLATSPRVAPGLLSWAAWAALREADEVYAATAEHPLAPALASAGVRLLEPPAGGAAGLADFLTGRAEQLAVVWLVSPAGETELADRLGSSSVVTGS
jgi:XTP/dITP diphosphohydrolase